MKKIITILLVAVVLASVLTSCSKPQDKSQAKPQETTKKLSVVATIFPEYDWVMNVLGAQSENVDVTLLLNTGVDLHSYQPTADDIIKISKSDLFIYVGGESDEWVEDVLIEATNKDMVVINLLEALGDAVKEEELKEGMEAEEEEAEEGEEEEIEYDEHVWLSLRNASVLVAEIRDALSQIDSKNAATYAKNAADYIEKLNALDDKYQSAVDGTSVKTVLFGDRFPFRYLVDDYDLDYYAAFVGCSAETEASFETIAFLANKVDELGLSTVLTLEKSDRRIAQTIVAASKAKSAKVLSMDSMQSVTSNDIKNGASYLSIMEKNLAVLTDALR